MSVATTLVEWDKKEAERICIIFIIIIIIIIIIITISFIYY